MFKNMLIETKRVTNIVKDMKMGLNGKQLDLSDKLRRKVGDSLEYRAKDIESIVLPDDKKNENSAVVEVKACDSCDIHDDNERVAVLNFASSKHPGGGFVTGAVAQEESICYRSNLYFDLAEHEQFYNENKQNLNKSLYLDGIIYSKNICVFRDKKLSNCEPYLVDIITCAAPNASAAKRSGVSIEKINETMERRIDQVFRVAIKHNVDHLVLGAFGCGVFGNSPEYVAELMHRAIYDKGYGKYFKKITFAMHDSMSANTKAFVKQFK